MGLETFCMTGTDAGLAWMVFGTVDVTVPDKPSGTTITGFYGMLHVFC